MEKAYIQETITRSKQMVETLENDTQLQTSILNAVNLICNCFNNKHKLLFAGNGGSAADAQHMSAEYVARFMFDRPGLASIALTTDTSALTAIGNDYGFDVLFSRQIEALGQAGDVLICYSTSGTSINIINAMQAAKQKNIHIIAMTSAKEGAIAMTSLADISIKIPHKETPHIQEGHLIVGHIMCGLVEKILFEKA